MEDLNYVYQGSQLNKMRGNTLETQTFNSKVFGKKMTAVAHDRIEATTALKRNSRN